MMTRYPPDVELRAPACRCPVGVHFATPAVSLAAAPTTRRWFARCGRFRGERAVFPPGRYRLTVARTYQMSLPSRHSSHFKSGRTPKARSVHSATEGATPCQIVVR